MSGFIKKPASTKDPDIRRWGDGINNELDRVGILADALDADKIVWLDKEIEAYYKVAETNPLTEIPWETWQYYKITEDTGIKRALVNAFICYEYVAEASEGRKIIHVNIHFPLNSEDKAGMVAHSYGVSGGTGEVGAMVPPIWAKNTTGLRSVFMGFLNAAGRIYCASVANWQGWVDLNGNSILEYQYDYLHIDPLTNTEVAAATPIVNGLYLSGAPAYGRVRTRIGIVAYAK